MLHRKKIIESIISKLDITPTMYRNATDKYKALAEFLQKQGVECDIYPQGSFRTGTVIRPYVNGKDADYDLDMVCELKFEKSCTEPKQVKFTVGDPLLNSELYSGKDLTEYNRCWTLKYAKIDGEIGFSMDVVPSVHEDKPTIESVAKLGIDSHYAEEAISITDKKTNGDYQWLQCNPLGYAIWFDEINAPFLAYNREIRRKQIFEENRQIFASVEDIPIQVERSSLQRVIQVLKRHRDIFYTNARRWDKRPISAIITTLAAQIAKGAPKDMDVYDLLQYVAAELSIYSELLIEDQTTFNIRNQARTFIKRDNAKWSIRNPINPNDNYTESWTREDAEYFFKWIKAAKADLVDNLDGTDMIFFNGLERGFGKSIVEGYKPKTSPYIVPAKVSETKPWGYYGEK